VSPCATGSSQNNTRKHQKTQEKEMKGKKTNNLNVIRLAVGIENSVVALCLPDKRY
jgi:hypothetical protein